MNTTQYPINQLREEHHAGCIALLIVLVALGTGCSNTELEGSWMSGRFNEPKFTSFVVMAVSRETTLRRVAEDAFVNQLQLQGVRGVPSYKIFPSNPEPLTREQVEKAVKQQAVQGVLVAWVAKAEKQARGAGGFRSAEDGFAPRYQENGSRSYLGSGMAYEYNVVTVDVQLYDVKTGDLIWSGVTRTFDTSNLESSTTYWAKVVMEELAKRRIV